ncbi:NADH-quinone oxidoreductase subunit J [Buchnera aphidicola (Hyadaphis tataricae)]|uniref:NADH-quinone oxidoreductase subunit J n=1 Tax=Buchnera aphidicola (Hyadaphis tataricae) TaxID=1241859 RepID=A0A4D6Y542_9GAMM|nr:NADH-quinone oxidoreductase subunit J [Buchnera aphidicola]QCI21478.1 NADH-quinone oxidoreductase subunit J [Buchnera aphidicola (Hyadaphis tataricae)]
MQYLFYICSIISVISTICVIVQKNAVYALLYLIVSLLSVAGVFFSIGAFFAGALEVIIYAGAIIVLFVFVIMMLNINSTKYSKKENLFSSSFWIFPGMLLLMLFLSMTYILFCLKFKKITGIMMDSKIVGIGLFGPYVLLVELSSVLLFSAIVVVFHIGSNKKNIFKK